MISLDPVRSIDWLQRRQLRLAALALVVMMLVTVADVLLRYTLNRPIRGSYDLVEAMLVVFVFNGMAAVFFRRRNIVIDLLDKLVGERALRIAIIAADAVSIIALILLAWAMLGPAMQSYSYGDRKLELQYPLYILWVVALAGMLGAIFSALARFRSGPPPAPQAEPVE
jgi:TRAP-type C4-dicarboxylate transport system permease small subunit